MLTQSDHLMKNEKRGSDFYFVIGAIILYNIGISYLSILRYESFSASVYDLGIMIQTIWNTSQGWLLQESINMGHPMLRFWMAHWEFIYLPIALIYKIFSSPHVILIIQTVLVSLGALPLYWLAKEKLENNLVAIILPISYLFHPAIQNANLCDVHGITLAAPFLLFAFYYLQQSKWNLFILHGILALLCREDSALILLMMGFYAYFLMKEKRVGMIIIVVNVIWFGIWFNRMEIRSLLGLPEFVIMEGAESHWDHLGKIKSDPLYLIKFLAKKRNIYYFFNLFAPVGFLSFFSPFVLLLASPILIINMISSYFYTHDIEHYYSATIVPFIYLAAILGLRNIMELLNTRQQRQARLYLPVIIGGMTMLLFFSKSNVFDIKYWEVTAHHRVIRELIDQIPQTASLTTDSRLAVHAAERHEIYILPDHVNDAEYILYDFHAPVVELLTRKSFKQPALWADNDLIREILNNRDYGIVHYQDGVAVFKKGAEYTLGLEKLAIVTDASEMNQNLNVEVTPGILCQGFTEHGTLWSYSQPDQWGPVFWKKAIHFTCYWTATTDTLVNQDLIFKVVHEDSSYQLPHQPVFGIYAYSNWLVNEIIRDEIFWEPPEGSAGGLYQIFVSWPSQEGEAEFVHLFDMTVE